MAVGYGMLYEADKILQSVDKGTQDKYGLGGTSFSGVNSMGVMLEDMFSGQKKNVGDWTKDILSFLTPGSGGAQARTREIDKNIKSQLFKLNTTLRDVSNAPDKDIGVNSGAARMITKTQNITADGSGANRIKNRNDLNNTFNSILTTATSLMSATGIDKTGSANNDVVRTQNTNLNPVNSIPKVATFDDVVPDNIAPKKAMSGSILDFGMKGSTNWWDKPIDELRKGGKNSGSSQAIEAEGGEIDVEFNDDYEVVKSTPILGASHERGGVDRILPPNHAILNKSQQARLNAGEPLYNIVQTLPDVNDNETARPGAANDPKKKNPYFSWIEEFKHVYDWIPGTINSTVDAVSKSGTDAINGQKELINILNASRPRKESTPVFDIKSPPEISSSDVSSSANSNIGLGKTITHGVGLGVDLGPAFDLQFKRISKTSNPNFPERSKSEPDNIADQTIADATSGSSSGIGSEINLFTKPKFNGLASRFADSKEYASPLKASATPVKTSDTPGTTPPKSPDIKKNWMQHLSENMGPEEWNLLANQVGNLMSMTQRDPSRDIIPGTNVANPEKYSPQLISATPYLENLNKSYNSLINFYKQSGKNTAGLTSWLRDSQDKIQQSVDSHNAELEGNALALNTRSSTEQSQLQSQLDAKRTEMQLSSDKDWHSIIGNKEVARATALSASLNSIGQYEQAKEDKVFSDMMRAKLKGITFGG